jgi:hypothetical protein
MLEYTKFIKSLKDLPVCPCPLQNVYLLLDNAYAIGPHLLSSRCRLIFEGCSRIGNHKPIEVYRFLLGGASTLQGSTYNDIRGLGHSAITIL